MKTPDPYAASTQWAVDHAVRVSKKGIAYYSTPLLRKNLLALGYCKTAIAKSIKAFLLDLKLWQ